MKLKNKRTGEIINNNGINFVEGNYKTYNSLTELNEEWEDVPEEPKEFWHIDFDGSLMLTSDIKCDKYAFDNLKEIGNYFETAKEAEKAVEKLKAVKRLKDKGFKAFSSNICGDDFNVNFKLTNHVDYIQSMNDFDCILDLGGEE